MYCSLMGSEGCDASGVAKGRCVVDSTMDGCMVVMPLEASDDCRRAHDGNRDAADMAAGTTTNWGTPLSDAAVVSTQYQGPGGRCIIAMVRPETLILCPHHQTISPDRAAEAELLLLYCRGTHQQPLLLRRLHSRMNLV